MSALIGESGKTPHFVSDHATETRLNVLTVSVCLLSLVAVLWLALVQQMDIRKYDRDDIPRSGQR